MARFAAAGVSFALVVATLSPLARPVNDDGFPLSTYPMFAIPAPPALTLDYALGVTADGSRRTLSPELVGTGEVLQAGALVQRAVHGVRDERVALCRQIAARVAADDASADVVAIRIVTGTHDAVEYLAHGVIGRERERARCPVERAGR